MPSQGAGAEALGPDGRRQVGTQEAEPWFSVGAPLLIATGDSIPLLCLEGVPDLPGAHQDEASLTTKFET